MVTSKIESPNYSKVKLYCSNNNNMQVKKQKITQGAGYHSPNGSTPPVKAQPGSGKKVNGHTPVAKKCLNYNLATPPKNQKKGVSVTKSLPTTPITILPRPQSHVNRSTATPSPKSSFAGSKCYEPPTPQSLPKPPTSWTGNKRQNMQALVSSMQREEQMQMDSRDKSEEVSRHLKLLLKVNA